MQGKFMHHFERDCGEITAVVSYTYSAGRKSRDPMEPDDPVEIEIVSVIAEDGSAFELRDDEVDDVERAIVSHAEDEIAYHRQEGAIDKFLASREGRV